MLNWGKYDIIVHNVNYYSSKLYPDNRILDLSGLTTPHNVPHVATGDFASGFWQHEPDFFVFLPDFGWALDEIRDGPQFDRLYQPVATLPGPREAEFVIYAHQ